MAKRSTVKDNAAKTKIANLLKDSNILGKKEEVDVLEKSVENKGTGWLKDEHAKLSIEVEQLKEDLQKAMNEIKTLKNAPDAPDAPVDTEKVKAGVRKIFKDLDDNFQGRNQQRKKYPDADLKILLNKFLANFPFLMKK
jgi:hypothetical protein